MFRIPSQNFEFERLCLATIGCMTKHAHKRLTIG